MIDLVFGKLTVIKEILKTPEIKRREKQWLCKCECGNEIIVFKSALKSKNTKSCGCIRAQTTPHSNFKALLNQYKKGARHRNLNFNLTENEFQIFTKLNCYYCGTKPKQEYYHDLARKKFPYIYNGIDRKNNSEGYSLENCVACCINCNYAKKEMTEKNFIDLIKAIYVNLNLGTKELKDGCL